ncbi:MAG: head-tail connector protein [Clostridia bacterium]|jgi:uncharacterized phage protein (predicted DNA packaging)|nr:head-tail connector protein [Clostridia bacterium]
MTVEEMKLYLRVDTDDDDSLIASLITAAEKYIQNAGVSEFAAGKMPELYETAVKMLVNCWYDNRDSIGKSDTISLMFKSIICQLSSIVNPDVS